MSLSLLTGRYGSKKWKILRERSNASTAIWQLQKVLKDLNRRSPQKAFRPDEPAKIDYRIGHLGGRPVPRLVIHFRSNGCSWKKTGGCAMCGFWNETSQFHEVIGVPDFIEQFKRASSKIDLSQYPILCFYNAGSVLNDEEVPFEALEAIFAMLSRSETLKQIVLESRLEYVSKGKSEAAQKPGSGQRTGHQHRTGKQQRYRS